MPRGTSFFRAVALVMVAALVVTALPLVTSDVATAQAAPVQQGVVWQAEYFNNTFLLGTPVLETQVGELAFDWGDGSPAEGVNPDNFSARFGTDVFFEAGTYRFFVMADDAVSLTVDFLPLGQQPINTFDAPTPGELITADVELSGGFHHLQVDFRESEGDAYLFVSWENAASNPSPPTFAVTPTIGLSNPWTVQYYNNMTLAGAPILARVEDSINVNWGNGSPDASVQADNFSSRWNSIQTLEAGTYELRVRADDAVRVFVNGALLINEWHGYLAQDYTATFNHAGGQLSFTVEHFEQTGAAFISLRVVRPGAVAQPGQSDQPSQPAAGDTARVTAWRLNVRSQPSTNGDILLKIDQGETYPVVGYNADRSWVQINVNGTLGWVSGAWVTVTAAPVAPTPTPAPQPPAVTGYFVTAGANTNIHAAPSFNAAVVGLLPFQQPASVIGRTVTNSWWQVQYGAVTGWVSALYVTMQPGANLALVPVTG